jgi:hypothetical protein
MRLRTSIVCFCILLLYATAVAQEITGNIAGTVTDPQGAVVPGATVTLTNTDRNAVVRTVKSGANGDYSAPLLPIGHYEVAVESSGFQKFTATGIVLNINDKLTVNAKLAVSGAAQTVTVQEQANQVELQSAQAAGLITGTQVRELALNGRNWEQLMNLSPGVSQADNSDQLYVGNFAPQGTNAVSMAVNGGRREQNNYMVDGADNVDRGSNITLLAFPSVDAIAEFKVIRGQYDPEYGRAASGQINVVTRGGTSKLHGGIYEFFRNDWLNANTYFNKRTQLQTGKANKPPILRYNNFGGTLGGPVYIPHLYEQTNKTFFFFSEEARRNIVYTLAHAEVPTSAMLQGNFAHPVCTGFTTSNTCATTGSTINPATFDPIAKAYIADIFSKYPQPNNATAADPFGFDSTLRGIFNFHEEIYRIDHNFGQKVSLFGKILRDTIPTREPGGLFTGMALDNIGSTSTNSPGKNYTFRGTIALNPTLLIEPGYSYSYGAILSDPSGVLGNDKSPAVAAAVKLPFTSSLARVPNVTLTGGSGPATFGPYRDFNQNHTAFTNLTKVHGTHTIKAGATFYHYRKHENAGSGNQGAYTFNTVGTPGSPTFNFEQSWANFLQGRVGTFSQSLLDLTADIRANQFEYYAQDTWRMRPNFTLTYGFRHSFFREPYDALGMLSNFDPRNYDPAKAPCILSNGNTDVTKSATGVLSSACNPSFDPLNGYIYAKPPAGALPGHQSPFGSKVGPEYNLAIAPRLGFAWDPWNDGKTSIRAGFGKFYDSGFIFGQPEFNIFNGIGYQNSVSFTNVTFANPTGGAPIPSTGIPGAATRIASYMDPNYKSPYSQQWSLDMQRDLYHGWMVDIGYYGNNGIHLPGGIDPNQPAQNSYLKCTDATPCFGGPNSKNPVSFSNAASGTLAPGVYVSNSNTNKLNALRPFIGYLGGAASTPSTRNIFTSNYSGLQSQMTKQFNGSTMINIAYTWSHSMTTYVADRSIGSIMPLQGDLKNNYGPGFGDRRHVLTGNFVWDLPFFRDQQNFVGHLLGGWEMSGIQTFQTGLPGTVASNQSFDPTGADCLGPSPCSFRANQVGNPNINAPHNFDTGWFNASAFTNPTPVNVNGVAVIQTTIPTERPGAVRLPGFWRTDLSLFKNIKFNDRFGGQFRLESFNTFNHTNPICCSSLTTSSASYNLIRSTRDPRIVQIAMKLHF